MRSSCTFNLACCSDPDLSSFAYRCGGNTSICPAGYACISGICQLGAGDVSDMSMDAVDLASATDQAGAPPPDLSGQPPGGPSAVAGCANPGYKVGQAFACPGTFDGSKLTSMPRLRAGRATCHAPPRYLVDQAACNVLPGFFAAAVPGVALHWRLQSRPAVPLPLRKASLVLWFGCGQLRAARRSSR